MEHGHGKSYSMLVGTLFSKRMMVTSMLMMGLALAVAGIVQIYLQRVLGMDFLTTQGFMRLWFAVFWVSAWGFALGVLLYIIDFFTLEQEKPSPVHGRSQNEQEYDLDDR